MGDLSRWSDESALRRGEAVHLATAFDDLGQLAEESLDPRLVGYLAGWRKFRRELSPEIQTIEEKVHHKLYGYEGTLDRRLTLRGRAGILDIKSGLPQRWHAVQLAAYANTFDGPLARWGIYLADDGTYRLEEYKDRHDWDVFKAALTIVAWAGSVTPLVEGPSARTEMINAWEGAKE